MHPLCTSGRRGNILNNTRVRVGHRGNLKELEPVPGAVVVLDVVVRGAGQVHEQRSDVEDARGEGEADGVAGVDLGHFGVGAGVQAADVADQVRRVRVEQGILEVGAVGMGTDLYVRFSKGTKRVKECYRT
jgi:hypothetical protein